MVNILSFTLLMESKHRWNWFRIKTILLRFIIFTCVTYHYLGLKYLTTTTVSSIKHNFQQVIDENHKLELNNSN